MMATKENAVLPTVITNFPHTITTGVGFLVTQL
jgi:hypothetical protein